LENWRWRASSVLLFLLALIAVEAGAGTNWYPIEVDVWQVPFDTASQRMQQSYMPLEGAQKKWRIHAYIPHLKDAYWLGVNYGLIDEARRLGVSLSIYEAGGYDQIEIQRRQINEGLAAAPDGVIVGAISLDGLNDLMEKAHEKGIPVIDCINGMSSRHIAARVAADFSDLGFQAGTYLLKMQKEMGRTVRAAWFPGPKGAGWVAAGDAGFRRAIDGGTAEIVAVRYGDTGTAAQRRLVEDVLDQHAELDYVVGTAVTAQAALKTLRKRGLTDRIKVIAYYYSPDVHRNIRRGGIMAAPTDHTVIQARIAVDTIVRILENKDYSRHVAPKVVVVDRSNIRTWDSSTTLSPRGFRPIFTVNE